MDLHFLKHSLNITVTQDVQIRILSTLINSLKVSLSRVLYLIAFINCYLNVDIFIDYI